MIQEIQIENLAILESLSLNVEKGFSVLTGETGAGKSVILSAAKLILGERAKSDWIKHDKEQLRIEMIFDISKLNHIKKILQDQELDVGNELVAERQILRTGKSRCRINGSLINLSSFSSITKKLLDLHGQHQQQSLLSVPSHLSYLDKFGGLDIEKEKFENLFLEWKSKIIIIQNKRKELKDFESQKDFFNFQWEELNKANLISDEENIIEQKLDLMNNAQKVNQNLNIAEGILSGQESSLLNQMNSLKKIMTFLKEKTGKFENTELLMDDIQIKLEKLLDELNQFEIPDHGDPREMDDLNSKMAMIQRLKTKYRLDLTGLIQLREERKKSLDEMDNFNFLEGELLDQIKIQFQKVMEQGELISQKRKKVAKDFEKKINSNLSFLGMGESVFECRWGKKQPEELNPHSISVNGMDELEFYFSGNPGNPTKPLKEIISGGEASRVMLAIKSVLSEVDQIPVLIFDEVDTGIGGHTANRIGEALEKISDHHQVIAITHLHQVASRANSHWKVSKNSNKRKTEVTVLKLNREQRVEELARMMGDDKSSETKKFAEELLARSNSK